MTQTSTLHGDALANVDRAQSQRLRGGPAAPELDTLRALAEAVRLHLARHPERIHARRTPDPDSEARLFRYSDTCANCSEPITGELIGVLADGDAYSWRHAHGFTFRCGGRVDRLAPQAIPADEAEAECSVHRKVSRWHDCEAGGTVTLLASADS